MVCTVSYIQGKKKPLRTQHRDTENENMKEKLSDQEDKNQNQYANYLRSRKRKQRLWRRGDD